MIKTKQIIEKYLKETKEINIENNKSQGIIIHIENEELVIKGNKLDLIELADYIISVALSEEEISHIHLDELTIINNSSNIKSMIIEKDQK